MFTFGKYSMCVNVNHGWDCNITNGWDCNITNGCWSRLGVLFTFPGDLANTNKGTNKQHTSHFCNAVY